MHSSMEHIRYGTISRQRKLLGGELFRIHSKSTGELTLSSPPKKRNHSMVLRRSTRKAASKRRAELAGDSSTRTFSDLEVIGDHSEAPPPLPVVQHEHRFVAAEFLGTPLEMAKNRPSRRRSSAPKTTNGLGPPVIDAFDDASDSIASINSSAELCFEDRPQRPLVHTGLQGADKMRRQTTEHELIDMSIQYLKRLKLQRNVDDAMSWHDHGTLGEGFHTGELMIHHRIHRPRHRRSRLSRPLRVGQLAIVEEPVHRDMLGQDDRIPLSACLSDGRNTGWTRQTENAAAIQGNMLHSVDHEVERLLKTITAPVRPMPLPEETCPSSSMEVSSHGSEEGDNGNVPSSQSPLSSLSSHTPSIEEVTLIS